MSRQEPSSTRDQPMRRNGLVSVPVNGSCAGLAAPAATTGVADTLGAAVLGAGTVAAAASGGTVTAVDVVVAVVGGGSLVAPADGGSVDEVAVAATQSAI